ncbi:hypothetical protein M3Y94_00393100 [Aphelenchoides besseyi]|nr:hypothetical protein M3Y94_00393100 [Aphelenchoides besseyi]
MVKPKTRKSTEEKTPKKLLGVNRPKARFGSAEVWNAFVGHYMKSKFENRMSSVDVRTRSNRSTAFLSLWRLALLSPNYNLNSYLHNKKAFSYTSGVCNSLVWFNDNRVLFRRLARHEFYGSDQFIEIIRRYSQKNRMFCMMNSIAIGYEEIHRSMVVVKAVSRTIFCYGNIIQPYSLDFCDPYTQKLEIHASTLTVEYLFDLLYNLDQIFPQCFEVHIQYYQWRVESNDLMECFVQNHQNNGVLTEFVGDLKQNIRYTDDIHDLLKTVFIPRLKKRTVNFVITYIQPLANDNENTNCSLFRGPARTLKHHEADLNVSLQTVRKRPTPTELNLRHFLNNENDLIERMYKNHVDL